ncbi:hypothetical protein SDC9_209897 [bioreactor metagenome]|uniref:Uncharacterized protein n=1 Tax=bioreactor metagenome TaxID=1076179 RepID=A0A645JGB2_9ZZZZ
MKFIRSRVTDGKQQRHNNRCYSVPNLPGQSPIPQVRQDEIGKEHPYLAAEESKKTEIAQCPHADHLLPVSEGECCEQAGERLRLQEIRDDIRQSIKILLESGAVIEITHDQNCSHYV